MHACALGGDWMLTPYNMLAYKASL